MQKINPTVLASSFAFYLLLTIIPLVILILNLLANLELIEVEEGLNLGNNFINILIFIFNLLWSSSKLTNNLLVISDVIYYNIEYRPRLKLRIISIILTIFIYIYWYSNDYSRNVFRLYKNKNFSKLYYFVKYN